MQGGIDVGSLKTLYQGIPGAGRGRKDKGEAQGQVLHYDRALSHPVLAEKYVVELLEMNAG